MLPIAAPWRPLATPADRALLPTLRRQPRLDEAWSPTLLRLAHDALGPDRARGVDGASPRIVTPPLLEALVERVAAGRWRPAPLRRAFVGNREVGIPSVEDQLIVAAWRLWAEPILDGHLLPHVHGFRPGRSCRRAVQTLVGHPGRALLRTDIRQMFPSIDHRRLDDAAHQVWPPGLHHTIIHVALAAWSPRRGLPTGVAFSPSLANCFCHTWIDPVVAAWRGPALRYADDFAAWLPDADEALRSLRAAATRSGLRLHPDKTRVHDAAQPADWPAPVLGFLLLYEKSTLRVRDRRCAPSCRA